LLLADFVEEPKIIEQWLSKKGGHKVEIQVPRRGEKRALVELATQNARQRLEELRLQWLNSEQKAVASLTELRDLLGLEAMPARIECYDISNTQGTNSVGAMVVFEQGEPKKGAYRKFKIKTVEGANDVASIQEILRRRLKRAAQLLGEDDRQWAEASPTSTTQDAQSDAEQQEPVADETPAAKRSAADESWAELPDLLLIDGGIGQLNGAIAVLRELNFERIPIAAVVKGINRDRFDLLLPGATDLIVLKRDSAALRLVQTIDEETDRYAKQYHRSLRSKSAIRSTLEDIPGVGPTRRKALLKAFGSLDGIRAASVEQIAALPGMTRKAAEEIKSLL
jgi:excinuclease ABC subunit C